jgi:hypothetical protein
VTQPTVPRAAHTDAQILDAIGRLTRAQAAAILRDLAALAATADALPAPNPALRVAQEAPCRTT